MKLLIDDANIEKIKAICAVYPIDGVSTNPSILAKAGRPPYETLHAIRAVIGPEADLHVQAVAATAEGMLEDARRILAELGENTYVKIPVTPEGLRAMKLLHAQNIRITATAIYTEMQAFLAAKAGAAFAAPYVNRIDNLGGNGIQTAKNIHDMFRANNLSCQLLCASFKNTQQVLELCRCGVGASTVSPDVLEGLIKNPTVTAAVDAFVQDFEKLCGRGKTMQDCG